MGVFTTAGKNEMLDSSAIALAALFNGDPEAGGTELSGGSPAYTRQTITLTSAVDGTITITNDVIFDVPGSSTINYVAFYNSEGTTLLAKDDVTSESYASQGTYTLDNITLSIN